MLYRRTNILGGTYFFTVNLANRNSSLLTKNIKVLRTVINQVKRNHPFKLDALVILPEHFHAIITLPKNDNDYSNRLMLIKSGFSRKIPRTEIISISRASKGERGIWQRRYWEHLIKDDDDYNNHINYIHYNPVKHGYVKNPADWRYSTIHHFIAKGIIDSNWGKNCSIEFGRPEFGE